ncbi:hypothetical protein [Dyadobacter sp. CY312]|uniref:hypothetical protein n=1 Tax=Dyadobacter sp. CY312 TaxID=2907303 RepID=UPI001F1EC324|nr:hypothetical protein [Dyadobacter sp. CY312]MCE7043256.1 hypothetical protein [Dyadobacter sp. CY312]
MIHEKLFNLTTDREAKVIVKGNVINGGQVIIDFEFLIKDKNDRYFHPPIGINHPQYWKLKRFSHAKGLLLQMKYSGLSKKQVNASLREFKQLAGMNYVFSDAFGVEENTKGLKGIRSNGVTRRAVAAV